MLNDTLFYKESGRIGLGAIGLMVVAGVAAALVLGFVYAYAIFYIPFIYLNFILTMLYGAGVGYAVMWGAKTGKGRNSAVVTLVACVLGLFAVYTQWVFWLHALSAKADDATFIWSPAELWHIIKAIGDIGVWSFGRGSSEPVKGVLLWIVWIIEAGMITVATVVVARFASGGVFCERCERWAEANEDEVHLELEDASVGNLEQLASGSFDSLKAIPLANPESPLWIQISTCSCPTCSEFNTLNASIVTHEIDSKGQVEKKEQAVIGGLLTPAQTLAELRAHWAAGGTPSTAAPAPPAAEEVPPPAE